MKTLFYAACTVVLLVTSMPAAAQEVIRRVVVDHSDLDLTSPKGAAALQRRVKRAVREACGGPGFTLQEKLRQRECARKAASKATLDTADAVKRARDNRAGTHGGFDANQER